QGRLLVIDAARGQTLSTLPLEGFDFKVTNELTDRLYLASGNGLLISLHDRRRRAPEFLQKASAPPAPKKAEAVEEKPPEPKEPPPVKKEPEPAPKKEPPKKAPEAPKKADPKAEEPKKEEPKAEEPKKEEPKKEEPKKE